MKPLNIKILYKDRQRKWSCFISGRCCGGELCRLMEKKLQLELQILEGCQFRIDSSSSSHAWRLGLSVTRVVSMSGEPSAKDPRPKEPLLHKVPEYGLPVGPPERWQAAGWKRGKAAGIRPSQDKAASRPTFTGPSQRNRHSISAMNSCSF